MEDFKTFRKRMLGTRGPGRVRNSWGVYDAFKHIRKNGWYSIGRPLKEHEFYTIIRSVNRLLGSELALGATIEFPWDMGKLELRKGHREAYFDSGKLKVTYPVDWDGTLRLWYADKEAMRAKTLVRREKEWTYHVKYCKQSAKYINKTFYEFTLNRSIKRELKENIDAGRTDTIYTDYNPHNV